MQKMRKKGMWGRHRQQGFSLMELCVVVAIAAVISAITIPLLFSMRERYKLRESATDVLSTFKRAQAEAVKRNARVAITISNGTTTCTAFLDDGGGVPANANNTIQDPAELTLFTTNTQTGNSLLNDTFLPGNPEFTSGGTLTNACQPGFPPLPCNSVDVVGGAGSSVQYRLAFSSAGHVTLLVSTDSGATFH
jgi:prepilin-type N-terminal cleavage/methylation domain-containing protein